MGFRMALLRLWREFLHLRKFPHASDHHRSEVHAMIRLLADRSSSAASRFSRNRLPADSVRGERLFESEHCIECHGVNGKGARIRARPGPPCSIAISLPPRWPAPCGITPPPCGAPCGAATCKPLNVDDQAAADLFAYFYSARFFEKPGDAGRGKRLFTERKCAECHGIAEVKNPSARPVSRMALARRSQSRSRRRCGITPPAWERN